MKIAVRSTSWFGEFPVDEKTGQVAGSHSGAVLVRRLLRLFADHDPVLIGHEGIAEIQGDGFVAMSLSALQRAGWTNDTVIVNMDVIDSPEIHGSLRRTWRDRPRLMNFVWWNLRDFEREVQKPRIALSTALFPTLCNSPQTWQEIRDLQRKHLAPASTEWPQAPLGTATLGVDVDSIPSGGPLADGPPRVLYPSTWLVPQKDPDAWLEIVDRARASVDLRGVMRLKGTYDRGAYDWLDVLPLPPTTEAYAESLQGYSAFLATALYESYGLAYVEALLAGVPGVFPDRPWVWSLVPRSYPLVYRTREEAAAMLSVVVEDRARAQQWIRDACGEDPAAWIRRDHDAADFGRAVKEAVGTWFDE